MVTPVLTNDRCSCGCPKFYLVFQEGKWYLGCGRCDAMYDVLLHHPAPDEVLGDPRGAEFTKGGS